MRSELSILAGKLWSEIYPIIPMASRSEVAQRIVDNFVEAGCPDIHECVKLFDSARMSVLDINEVEFAIYDEFDESVEPTETGGL